MATDERLGSQPKADIELPIWNQDYLKHSLPDAVTIEFFTVPTEVPFPAKSVVSIVKLKYHRTSVGASVLFVCTIMSSRIFYPVSFPLTLIVYRIEKDSSIVVRVCRLRLINEGHFTGQRCTSRLL